MSRRTELITWDEVNRLIQHLIPQFETEFDAMVIITRGGIVPGGMLCEALDIKNVLTAAVDFPFEVEREDGLVEQRHGRRRLEGARVVVGIAVARSDEDPLAIEIYGGRGPDVSASVGIAGEIAAGTRR